MYFITSIERGFVDYDKFVVELPERGDKQFSGMKVC